MKVLAATLAVLLLVAICSLAEAAPPRDSSIGASSLNQDIPISCCFQYVSRRIPRKIISFAYRTSTSCLKPAVVLVTTKGMRVCANPEVNWVQKYLKELETAAPVQ